MHKTDSNFLQRLAAKGFVAALVVLFMVSQAAAEQVLVFSFFQERPLSGVVVEIDGQRVGKSDDSGSVEGTIEAGSHTLKVLKDGALLAKSEFVTAVREDAEISVAFTDFKGPPKIAVAAFEPSEKSSSALGAIRGMIIDESGQPVAGAAVTAGAGLEEDVSDSAGKFFLELPRGEQVLQVAHPGYTTVSNKVRVVANVGVKATIALRGQAGVDQELSLEDFSDVEEVEVVGSFNPAEDAADLEKFSVAITDSVSIEDLLRFGDSDVASALKRIVGVAVTGGKYANIRGLDGRYISSTLNGVMMPSTDPFRRDVQLDLFPSQILGGIEIQKSFTADLPGDTSGGVIKMTTQGIPEEDVTAVSVSLGYLTGVTGKSFLTYNGGSTDALGFDDLSRELPGFIRAHLRNGNFGFNYCEVAGQQDCVPLDANIEMARQLSDDFVPYTRAALPNFGFSGRVGRMYEGEKGKGGVYASATYDQSYSSRQGAKVHDFQDVGNYRWDTFAASVNSYLVAGYESNAGWSVSSKTMLLRDAEDRTSSQRLIQTDEENAELDSVVLEWVERQFIGQTFEGSLPLFGTDTLDARLALSQTSRYSPDRREYLYRGGIFGASNFARNYSDLAEDGIDFGLDYQKPLAITDALYTNLRFGLSMSSRERKNEQIRLGLVQNGDLTLDLTQSIDELLADDNFDVTQDSYWLLRTNGTTSTDTYKATQDINSLYVSTETDYGTQWSFTVGGRVEHYEIDLRYPNNSDVGTKRSSTNVLPGFLATYRPVDDIQIRAGYSRTVSRPNITELANSTFWDQQGRQYLGCPSCLDTQIDNYDIRGEIYFGGQDSISLALFYKNLKDPLERAVVDGSGSATSALTFRNSVGATLKGLELDGSKLIWDGIDNVVTLSGNIAFVDSEVELDADSARLELNPQRALQGQSPFLANIQLAMDNFEHDIQFTVVANYFDDRIYVVGRSPRPAIKELGRAELGMSAEKTFAGGSKVSLKLKNLLNAKTEFEQRPFIIEQYRRGVSLSLGYSYSF